MSSNLSLLYMETLSIFKYFRHTSFDKHIAARIANWLFFSSFLYLFFTL
ncbi:hypothetical protein QY96_01318 [Bacillus thermotolerans]|nr:hypothetical protein QY96_01318 [Bacillus thermotolerans]